MLKTLDVLLGVTVVMLMVSLLITILTQFVTNLLNSRGRHLMHGLADLLEQLDPGLDRKIAEAIAGKVLTHPLIRESGRRLGTVVHREELTGLLLELASAEGPQKLDQAAHDALVRALAANGISDPGKVLANARSLALQLELSNPELAATMRQNLALLREANSNFLAKINGWFDQTMDRVSQRFTFSTRAVTFGSALLVAFVLQLDTVALVNRLWTDQQLRDSLVREAIRIDKQPAQAGQVVPQLSAQDRENLRQLARNDVIFFPQTAQEWSQHWSGDKVPARLPGIALSALLLSLGAPFWYNALKNLVKLRSALANKEEQQRQERQSTQAAPAVAGAGGAGAEKALLVGEKGDLGAYA
jgi:hypothetical protein